MSTPTNRDLLRALITEAAQAGIEAVTDPISPPRAESWRNRHRIAEQVARDTEGLDGEPAPDGDWTSTARAVLERMVGGGP